jgi:hypothetical protein
LAIAGAAVEKLSEYIVTAEVAEPETTANTAPTAAAIRFFFVICCPLGRTGAEYHTEFFVASDSSG